MSDTDSYTTKTDTSTDSDTPFISFQNIVNKLHSENIMPDMVILENIIGEILGKDNYSDFVNAIPNTNDFYNNLKKTIQDMGLPNIINMDTHDTIQTFFNAIAHLPTGSIMPISDSLTIQTLHHHDDSSDEESEELPEGEYPMNKWLKNPKIFAEFMMEKRDEAKNAIQSFTSRYLDEDCIVNVLSNIFNNIPITDSLRQDLDNDIITIAVNQFGEGITRGSFIRNTYGLINAMNHADKYIYTVEEDYQCCICNDNVNPIIIHNKDEIQDIYIVYEPYKCTHRFCRPCFYGLQATALGDYCPCCRTIFK